MDTSDDTKRVDTQTYGIFGRGKTVVTKEFPKQYTEKEVLNLLENYDRELKLNTFAYTKPCTYTVAEWFDKNKK